VAEFEDVEANNGRYRVKMEGTLMRKVHEYEDGGSAD